VIEQTLVTRFPPRTYPTVSRQLQLDQVLALPRVQAPLPVVIDVIEGVPVNTDDLLLRIRIGVVANEPVIEI
jgi:hypothetical protein